MYSSLLFFSLHINSLFLFHSLSFFLFLLSFAHSLSLSLSLCVCMWLYVDLCRSPFFDHTHSPFNLRSVFTSFTVYEMHITHLFGYVMWCFAPWMCVRKCVYVNWMRFCLTFQSTTFECYLSGTKLVLVLVHIRCLLVRTYVHSFMWWCSTCDQFRNIWVIEFYTHMYDDCTRTCFANIINCYK